MTGAVPLQTMEPDSRKSAPADRGPRRRLRFWHLVFLLLLLVFPVLALHRLSAHIHWQWLAAYTVVVSLVTYAVYGADKDSAADERSTWRASEKLLHAFELAGGWPGAFLAQRRLRHKCSKVSYLLVFWLIVSVEVFTAADYVFHWRMTRSAWRYVFPARDLPGVPADPPAGAPDAGTLPR